MWFQVSPQHGQLLSLHGVAPSFSKTSTSLLHPLCTLPLTSKVWNPFLFFLQLVSAPCKCAAGFHHCLSNSLGIPCSSSHPPVLHWLAKTLSKSQCRLRGSFGFLGRTQSLPCQLPFVILSPALSCVCFLRHLWEHQGLFSSLLSEGLSPVIGENFFPLPNETQSSNQELWCLPTV